MAIPHSAEDPWKNLPVLCSMGWFNREISENWISFNKQVEVKFNQSTGGERKQENCSKK